MQAGDGYRLRWHLGLSPLGAVSGQHRGSAAVGQSLGQSAVARRRGRAGGPGLGRVLSRWFSARVVARRHRLLSDRALGPLDRRRTRAVYLRLRCPAQRQGPRRAITGAYLAQVGTASTLHGPNPTPATPRARQGTNRRHTPVRESPPAV